MMRTAFDSSEMPAIRTQQKTSAASAQNSFCGVNPRRRIASARVRRTWFGLSALATAWGCGDPDAGEIGGDEGISTGGQAAAGGSSPVGGTNSTGGIAGASSGASGTTGGTSVSGGSVSSYFSTNYPSSICRGPCG